MTTISADARRRPLAGAGSAPALWASRSRSSSPQFSPRSVLWQLPNLGVGTYWINLAALVLIYSIACLGFNVAVGWSGQLALAHAGFYGLGAYTTAVLWKDHGWPFFLAMLTAGVLAAIVGVLVSWPAMRLKGFYLAIATLALGSLMVQLFVQFDSITGGGTGKQVPLFRVPGTNRTEGLYYVSLGTAVVVFFLVWRVVGTRVGRTLKSVRDIEIAAQSVGIQPVKYRLLAFGVASGVAAIAGGLQGQFSTFISPGFFGTALLVAILDDDDPRRCRIDGGFGRRCCLRRVRDRVLSQGQARLGVVAADGIRRRPHALCRRASWWARLLAEPDRIAASAEGRRMNAARVLDLADISVRFGGNVVFNELSLAFDDGFNGLVGPNGAGKTTLFNVISGFVRPQRGSVQLVGREITGMSPARIAAQGVGRTFQTPRLIQEETVIDNVTLGRHAQTPNSHIAEFLALPGARRAERESRDMAVEMLDRFGLSHRAYDEAGSVPLGSQKIVEVARGDAVGAARPARRRAGGRARCRRRRRVAPRAPVDRRGARALRDRDRA